MALFWDTLFPPHIFIQRVNPGRELIRGQERKVEKQDYYEVFITVAHWNGSAVLTFTCFPLSAHWHIGQCQGSAELSPRLIQPAKDNDGMEERNRQLRDARIVCVTASVGGSVWGWKFFRMVHLQFTFNRKLWNLLITDLWSRLLTIKHASVSENTFRASSKNCGPGIILNIDWHQHFQWLDQCIFSNGKTKAPNFACPLAVVHSNAFSSPPHSTYILVHNTGQDEME